MERGLPIESIIAAKYGRKSKLFEKKFEEIQHKKMGSKLVFS